jgi:hypothetical protein
LALFIVNGGEICLRGNFFRRVSTDLQEYFVRGIVRKTAATNY